MGTNHFNALGFKVLDLMNNEVPINQIQPSTQTQSVSAKPSSFKSLSMIAYDPIDEKFPSIRHTDPYKHIKHLQHKPITTIQSDLSFKHGVGYFML